MSVVGKGWVLAFSIFVVVFLGLIGGAEKSAGAAERLPGGGLRSVGTLEGGMSSSYGAGNWAYPDLYHQYATPEGNIVVIRSTYTNPRLSIQTYNLTSLDRIGSATTIGLQDWPEWGGFYAAPNGDFYVLVGRKNIQKNDQLDVVAVRRYDSNWNLLGTAYVKGGASQGRSNRLKGIALPFNAGAPHMLMVGDRLVVHMSREMYNGHQGNLTFEVDTETMTATTFNQLGDDPYTSHSFQQLIAMNGSNLITIDHGDGFPRSINMGVMANYPTSRDMLSYDLFEFNGVTGDNFTGASVTDLISGPQGIIVLGNSIRQPNAPNGTLGSEDERRNAFAIAAAANGTHSVRWLTQFTPNGPTEAGEVRAVQVGSDRYAVLFGVRTGEFDQMEYRLVDSAGAVLSRATFPGVFYSTASQPIFIDHKIYWIGLDGHTSGYWPPAYLFGLNVQDPANPSLHPLAAKPAPAEAKIDQLVIRGPKQVRRGKMITYGARIFNSGNVAATGVKLGVRGRGVRVNKKVERIPAGKSMTVKVRFKFKKLGKIKATFKVTSSNAGGKTARKRITIRR